MDEAHHEPLRAELDLYRRLLDLTEVDDPLALLDATCALALQTTGAELAFLGLWQAEELVWSASHGMTASQTAAARDAISGGVLRAVRDAGRAVQLSSALLDPQFQHQESVRRNRIEAAICAPFSAGDLRGALYLQRHTGGGPFPDTALGVVERIVRHLPAVGRPLLTATRDPTAPARARLLRCGVIGRSAAVGALLDQVAALAPLDIDALLTGPTGSGKTQIARLIHDNSRRAAGAFVAVNCAAIQDTLFEAELFGVRAGAYTHAKESRAGRVTEAQRGTLFLDEVGELTPAAQSKLLQLLQERVFFRVGDATPVRADVRVLAATHRDLDADVKAGRFRDDLRYRLEVVPLRVPGLEERRGDIRLLARHFLEFARERHPALGAHTLTPGALDALAAATWPGQVRQLHHAIEAGMVRAHA